MGIKLSDYLVQMTTEDDGYRTPVINHWCKACNEVHGFACLGEPFLNGAKWTWDSDVLAPTMTPSMNISYDGEHGVKPYRCHYFLRRGMIEYLDDCTHELKGRTVPLPPIPSMTMWQLTGRDGPEPPKSLAEDSD